MLAALLYSPLSGSSMVANASTTLKDWYTGNATPITVHSTAPPRPKKKKPAKATPKARATVVGVVLNDRARASTAGIAPSSSFKTCRVSPLIVVPISRMTRHEGTRPTAGLAGGVNVGLNGLGSPPSEDASGATSTGSASSQGAPAFSSSSSHSGVASGWLAILSTASAISTGRSASPAAAGPWPTRPFLGQPSSSTLGSIGGIGRGEPAGCCARSGPTAGIGPAHSCRGPAPSRGMP
mmetsp:Transcript_83039/g.216771  ORF Transcript_83039/g.216771 Transcript_83039/m.216771 type:complete len:238 (+) Transcript_83039:448-1161(+)